MIKITNGQMTLTVPNSAYYNSYKACGFHPVEDEESVVSPAGSLHNHEDKALQEEDFVEETEDIEGEDDGVEDEEIDLSEIPLGEMDFYQLESYADALGINHKGVRSKKELRALIKENL